MKKKTDKPSKLTRFEKRVAERHRRQEEEYGRDEFLFGTAEDDEEVDVEYDTGNWTADEVEEAEAAPVPESPAVETEAPKPLVGERTEMISSEIVEAELAHLADVFEDDAAEADVSDADTASVPVDEDDDDDFDFDVSSIVVAAAESMLAHDAAIERMKSGTATSDDDEVDEGFEDEIDDEDDFDFYEMSETAQIEAVAVANELYGRTDAPVERKPKVHRDTKASGDALKNAKANAKNAKSNAKNARTGARNAKVNAKNTKATAKYDKAAEKYEKAASKYEKKTDKYEEDERHGLSMSDRLIIITGVCVLIMAALAGTVFYRTQTVRRQVASFSEVGTASDGIYVIGESGLNAVVASRASFIAVEEEPASEDLFTEMPVAEEPAVEDSAIEIVMKVTSVQSDLKIKFVNKAKDKLITGIPFSVTVICDSGKEYHWTDENMDGLMYHTEVPNGTYKVVMTPLEGPEYEDYIMPADVSGIKVTDNIEYKKIDVADEVKTEAEVNVAAEDTGVQDTTVESVNTDTVEWVESTKTLISGSESDYVAISRDDIPVPEALKTSSIGTVKGQKGLVRTPGVYMMPYMADTYMTLSGTTVVKDSSGYIEISNWPEGAHIDNVSCVSSDEGIATVTNDGLVYGVSAGTVTMTATVTYTDSEGNEKTETLTSTVIVSDPDNSGSENGNQNNGGSGSSSSQQPSGELSVKIDKTTLKMYVGDSSALSATVTNPDGTTDSNVTWYSSDYGVVYVQDGSLYAASEGTVTIAAVSNADNSKYASCTVSVLKKEEAPSIDTGAKFIVDGFQLYYMDAEGNYQEATIGDYYNFDVFYFRNGNGGGDAVYKYTGWQTIDGSTYFFDKDGNYVTGEQVIQGAKYTFDSNGHLQAGSGTMGIDVSKWNGSIDWTAVRNSGVSYAIIRCGYRGSSTGALIEDPTFRTNIAGAKAAGIQVGAYFYTQAVSEVEAVEEASMAVGLCSGYGLSLPLFIDVEHSGGRGDSIDAGTRTAIVKAFCQTVRNSGYTAGVYSNKTWFTSRMNASQLTGYKIWLAQYAATPTYTATRYDYWQYTSKGSVAGIKGNVDLNIKY
ncbi:MAG: Ig-like domain-containing protein [Lachnospiraceae bacterium]|nr:Ig-like domain-containing protein [Lachnospiraceae bacterium]